MSGVVLVGCQGLEMGGSMSVLITTTGACIVENLAEKQCIRGW